MAIEYASNSGEAQTPMSDTDNDQNMEPDNDADETVDIPMSMLGGKTVSPGDVVRLEVVSVNEDSGTVTAKYATEKPGSAIDQAASKFEA